MRWFAGTSGGADVPAPAGARQLWEGPDALWLIGDWPDADVRVLERGNAKMAVLGHCRATDAELRVGMAAARGGGVRSLTCWPGSYHVILRLGRRTLVLGDLAGLRPVFHTSYGGGTVFASQALPLADLTRAELDADLLAARLVCPDVPELTEGRSLFTGVRRLGPGHTLELGSTGQAATRLHEQPAARDFSGAAVALRDALTVAVDRRVKAAEHPGTDLSGGRDSAAVSLLAARAAGRDIIALTWDDPVAPDDPECAARIAMSSARLRHLLVPADDGALPYSGLESLPEVVSDEPDQVLVGRARVERLLTAARGAGVDMQITGYGGDAVLGVPPAYIADLMRGGHRVKAARHAHAWARLSGVGTGELTAAVRKLARTSFAQALTGTAASLVARQETGPPLLAWCTPGPAAGWATPEARQSVAQALRTLAAENGESDRLPGDRSGWVAVRRAAERQRALQQLGEASGVQVQSPYLDTEVVRAALSVPAWARERGDGPRALLHAALDPLVPRTLFDRVGKGDYSVSELRGLRANAERIRELTDRPLLVDLGVLDAAVLRGIVANAVLAGHDSAKGIAAAAPVPLGALADIVAAEVWLRSVAAGNVTRWNAAPATKRRLTAVA